jgi:hypothetical protein
VPRFKFALRGAFASTADRAQTVSLRSEMNFKFWGVFEFIWGNPAVLGFVFKLQFSKFKSGKAL